MTTVRPHRVGQWLPSDQEVLDQWLGSLIEEVSEQLQRLHPIIDDFRALIETDPEVFMLFHQMFEQLPERAPFDRDPLGARQVRGYGMMLQLLNAAITRAPVFDRSGLVGLPINAILDWPMSTGAGTAAFLHPKVNSQLHAILDEWSRFLRSKDSLYVLSEDARTGWFGEDALAAMPNFDREFLCDPSAPHRGFSSWDDFFTRQFRPGVRPVADPADDAVIVNACESAPYRLARDVAPRERFWIKSQPYSLLHMLAADTLAPRFVGGTVYQAFLNSVSYHRWHSPVSGTVVKTRLIPGTYYAQARAEGMDPDGIHDSQGYITEIATRALIFIEADNPRIGLMCFMPVGMGEVSTCDIRVYEGQHLTKGDPIGMFHYGGSTHCLIFRPEVKLSFDLRGQTPGVHSSNIRINERIATVG
jgi:phosphatidylserine decarboxylase